MTYEATSRNEDETRELATKIAPLLTGGLTIRLESDLGGGKTTFAQGLARGLGYDGEVTSPTFTLSRVYMLPSGLELHHYDLYRLGQSGVVGDELNEDMHDSSVITLIEWAHIIAGYLPADHLRIDFSVTGETSRLITIASFGPRSDKILGELTA